MTRARRLLRALQVEPTTRCTRSCAVCPRSALIDRWRTGDMNAATWALLRPDLRLARHVHLQGWGEPLLHPGLCEMVRDARSAGCGVGLTTNTDLLEGNADWIVDEGVDLLDISVAGAEADHTRLRDGSDLGGVWRALAAVARLRRRDKPRLQVSYLLTADNAKGLPEVVRASAEAGADEVFVIHLEALPTIEIAKRAAFTATGLSQESRDALDRAAARARAAGIGFREPARAPQELLVCALDPTRFAFVTWDGCVAPCVHLGLPVQGTIPRIVNGADCAVDRMIWGDLHDQTLHEILEGDRATSFRSRFVARRAAEGRFVSAQRGWGPSALRRLERAASLREAELSRNRFPVGCAGCPKSLGW